MLVQRILNFIKLLEKEDKPIACDVKLNANLINRFSQKPEGNDLIAEDIQFLTHCFKTRWEEIIDSDDDYTCNSSTINKHWIDLAKDLESVAQKKYLKILIPTVINDIDLNDLSLLTETVNLFNFFLGFGGTLLYRKLSFCKHLENKKFVLSTYRNENRLCAVTVDELARLKRCKETQRQVIVGTETFANFWDLMRKKVFVVLTEHGKIPVGLLPHLVELIERYYLLKSNGSDFSAFKNDIESFFCCLYSSELNDVNALYGAKVNYKENEEYLLDVFIALHTATHFSDIELEIRVLAAWLFELNPGLKSTSKELEAIYAVGDKAASVDDPGYQSEVLENCCRLLISLLTTHFEVSVFSQNTFSLWDKSNNVFPEASNIFSILLPLIASNRPDELEAAYDKIIRDVIVPAKQDGTLYTNLTRYESTKKWLELAYHAKIPEVSAYWFKPELLFTALRHFNINNPIISSQVNQFLDDLIQTYAQDQNDLMKQFRVNILFTEFINSLSEHHHMYLLRLIKLCDIRTAKATFLNSCIAYINERLYQVSQVPSEGFLPQFFLQVRKVDCFKLFKISEGANDVQAILKEYKTELPSLSLEPRVREAMSNYLIKVGQPILSVTEKESVKECTRTPDYIGQYT